MATWSRGWMFGIAISLVLCLGIIIVQHQEIQRLRAENKEKVFLRFDPDKVYPLEVGMLHYMIIDTMNAGYEVIVDYPDCRQIDKGHSTR